MPAPTHDELASLRAEMAALRARYDAELAALRRHLARPRRRAWPLVLALALLVALVPTSILAVNPFTDLVPGSPHNANIDAIYTAGVTTGCAPDAEYCPTASVTREEMASFLARLGGLGSNPPVANAGTLRGYAPDGLVRAAVGQFSGAMVVPLGGAMYQPVQAVTLTAPGPGLVLVNTSVSLRDPAASCPCRVIVRLHDEAGTVSAPSSHTTLAGGGMVSAGHTALFTVAAAGPVTYVLDAGLTAGAAAEAFNPTLTALFVPFGATGGTTLDVP